jgi:hypothetical protein
MRRAETKKGALIFLREMGDKDKEKMLNPTNDANVIKDARNQYYFSNQCSLFFA